MAAKIAGSVARPEETKDFHISDVLSIVTGRLVSTRHMEGIYEILNYMTNDQLYTHQLIRALQECRPWILPLFKGYDFEIRLKCLDTLEDPSERHKFLTQWLGDMITVFGETIAIEPIPVGSHARIDPVEGMVGADRVIVLSMKGDSRIEA